MMDFDQRVIEKQADIIDKLRNEILSLNKQLAIIKKKFILQNIMEEAAGQHPTVQSAYDELLMALKLVYGDDLLENTEEIIKNSYKEIYK